MAYTGTHFRSKGEHAMFSPLKIALLFPHTTYPESTVTGRAFPKILISKRYKLLLQNEQAKPWDKIQC